VSHRPPSQNINVVATGFLTYRSKCALWAESSKKQKRVYSIKDNTIAFWFTNGYGKLEPPKEETLNEFVSKRFERFYQIFLAQYLKKTGETVTKTGRWWGQVEVNPDKFKTREIDVISETQTNLYIGECKWTNKKPFGLSLID
jgi:AAA+ ATPase superfamily predicted ATPase